MTPPRRGYATVVTTIPEDSGPVTITKEAWIRFKDEDDNDRVFRVAQPFVAQPGTNDVHGVEVLEITTPSEIERILKGDAPVEFDDERLAMKTPPDPDGGYGSVTLELNSAASGDITLTPGEQLSHKTDDGTRHFQVARETVIASGESIATVPVTEGAGTDAAAAGVDGKITAVSVKPVTYASGADRPGAYVSGPAPHPTDSLGFLPLSVAISFLFMWAISGSGQPSNMVRLMAFRNSQTLKRAIFTVAVYYTCIYLQLVFIFCCARVLVPGLEAEPDRIMPEMAVFLTDGVGAASEKSIKYLSYLCTLLVGSIAMVVAINPPDFLQDIIVYVGSGLAACFLAPVIFMLYWPRANETGCIIGMLSGFAAHFSMYMTGMFVNGSFFRPYRLLDFDPIIVGLLTSFDVPGDACNAAALR